MPPHDPLHADPADFRQDAQAFAVAARAAAMRQDWHAAVDAWESRHRLEECDLAGALGLAEAYRGSSQSAKADAVIDHYSNSTRSQGSAELAVSYALNAQAIADWPEALDRWQAARSSFPDAPAIWAGEAAILQILGRTAEAEELTGRGVARFPDSIDIASQHCSVALLMGDWFEAELRLARMEDCFRGHSYLSTAAPGIRDIIQAGVAHADVGALQAIASKADAAGRWAFSATVWQRLHEHQSDRPEPLLGLARAFSESRDFDAARRVLAAGVAMFPHALDLRVGQAGLETDCEEWVEAAGYWQELLRLFPDERSIWPPASAAFRDAAWNDLAAASFKQAIDCDPTRTTLRIGCAMNAEQAGDWPTAQTLWDDCYRLAGGVEQRTDAPGEGPTGDAQEVSPIEVAAQQCNAAIRIRDWLGADLCHSRLQSGFPMHPYTIAAGPTLLRRIDFGLASDDIEAIRALAAKADDAKQTRSAERIWRALSERLPPDPWLLMQHSNALVRCRRFEDAEQVVRDGMERFPDLVDMRAQSARIAHAREDWPQAARRWQDVLDLSPGQRSDWIAAATAYRKADLTELADRLLARAISLDPTDVEFHILRAVNAEHANDWLNAVACWEAARRLRPEDLGIANSRGDAIWQETISRLEHGAPATPDLATVPVPDGDDQAAILKATALRFEGLGDNCEFGIVQRRFGADPIGLFRFAAINVSNLTIMLNEELGRLGDPEFTRLDLTPGGEYLVQDTRGFYLMHSFVKEGSVEPARFLKQQLTRIGFLNRKLLEDLRNAEKVFVYKASYGISLEEILALSGAVASFGENTLLVVRKAEAGDRAGSVMEIKKGLLVACVATLYDTEVSPIDFVAWRKILELSIGYKETGVVAEH